MSIRQLLWALTAPAAVALTFAVEPDALLRAQTEALEGVEIPATLPEGMTLSIGSSEAMRLVNEALRSRFSQQYGGTPVDVNYQSADEAIQALLDGDTDLAAIGRGLTEAEAQAGLEQISLARHKIAIITSPENPFEGSLTVEQFAQIFRGEITNWSEVGGPDAPIVLIDRPAVSDTRQAFRNYPVFQNAPFEATADAVALDADSTQAVIEALEPNAIGYAIAEQVLDNPAVKIVPMHGTPPDDPRYPFSQPLTYVYQGNNPSPGSLAFLGYATNPDNESVIEAARAAASTAEPGGTAAEAETEVVAADPAVEAEPVEAEVSPVEESVTVPEAEVEVAPATGRTRGVPWWPWLLALPVLGGLLWWLLRNQSPVAAPPAATEPERRIILTPRSCKDAYAYWELPQSEIDALKRQNCSLALRLHDVTDIKNIDHQPPHSMKQFDCDLVAQGDLHLPITFDDRDYLVELGYFDKQEDWHALARSATVRVPACPRAVPDRVGGIGAAASAAGLTAAGVAAATKARPVTPPPVTPAPSPEPARVIITPRDCRHVYAYWELPASQVQELATHQHPLRLRLYDVTELPGLEGNRLRSTQEFDCELSSPGDFHLPIPMDNRDYRVELGYVNSHQEWHALAKSDSVRVPACEETAPKSFDTTSIGAAAAAAAGFPAPGRATNPSPSGFLNKLQNQGASLQESVQRRATDLSDRARNTPKDAGTVSPGLVGTALAGGAAAVAGTGVAAQSLVDKGLGKGEQTAGIGAGVRSDMGAESRIILVPRGADSAYAYWELAPAHLDELKRQGATTMVLRIHDATNLELDYQLPHGTQEYLCGESDRDKHVPIPTPDRDYVAELGFLTEDVRWLQLLRSLHVRIG